eukprot:TRINITY_DN1829_c0_g1_i3.p1 TRINITY_DN1829_c0_g1~~TRINITY_DN1829_c0_g1_i3.p1  ORF type:complete len:138 (-),score=20.73 TRINITY_DN1829_c0_g1_i3:72-485(-)
MIYSAGWWIFADAFGYARYTDDPQPILFSFCIPGLVGTLSLIMLNIIDWSKVSDSGMGMGGDNIGARAKCFLFTSMMLGFSAIFAAIWILADVYASSHSKAKSSYPGVAILLSNLCIFLSSVVLRAGRGSSSSYGMF